MNMSNLSKLTDFFSFRKSEFANIPTRNEIHVIPTVTIPDTAFLKGDLSQAKPVSVAGDLRIAHGKGRLPAVVIVHGSGGVGANVEMWSRQLNSMGVSAFVLDGFTGRGLTAVHSNQGSLGRLNLMVDAYRALAVLSRHPRVDPEKIGIMGFSRGGQVALYSSLKRFNFMWNDSKNQFAAHAALYPDCSTSYIGETDTTGVPISIHHGTSDDYSLIEKSHAYYERLHAAEQKVSFMRYDGAHHGFDCPITPKTPKMLKGAQTVRNVRINELEHGFLMNEGTGSAFSYDDPNVEKNPHIAGHQVSGRGVRKNVVEFFRKSFDYPLVSA